MDHPIGGGEGDISAILEHLTIERRDGIYVYVCPSSDLILDAAATIEEDEGTTYVVERATAESLGLEWSFEAAWLTVEAHSALDAVGLTAALTTALADACIACNVLAGFHHDHLLVPRDRVDDAMAALQSLRHDAEHRLASAPPT